MLSHRYLIMLVILFGCCGTAWANEYKLHITQQALEDRQYLDDLIRRAKAVGINTFIIELSNISNSFERNILLVKNAGIKYIARIMVFPSEADHNQLKSEVYLMSRYRLVEAALELGAAEIQLDYIRYAAASANLVADQNNYDASNVMNWFRDKIDNRAKLKVILNE